jgi:hypothetical protein
MHLVYILKLSVILDQGEKMRQLTWKIVIPLTLISFVVFTKWWYVLPIDAPDTMMVGFPLPYACDGWHTSMSLQIFFSELMIDSLTYFLFWFIIIFSINRFIARIIVRKIVSIFLLSIAGLFICGLALIAFNPTNVFYLKRPFDAEMLVTGYKFVWDGQTRPENFDFDEYERKRTNRKDE